MLWLALFIPWRIYRFDLPSDVPILSLTPHLGSVMRRVVSLSNFPDRNKKVIVTSGERKNEEFWTPEIWIFSIAPRGPWAKIFLPNRQLMFQGRDKNNKKTSRVTRRRGIKNYTIVVSQRPRKNGRGRIVSPPGINKPLIVDYFASSCIGLGKKRLKKKKITLLYTPTILLPLPSSLQIIRSFSWLKRRGKIRKRPLTVIRMSPHDLDTDFIALQSSAHLCFHLYTSILIFIAFSSLQKINTLFSTIYRFFLRPELCHALISEAVRSLLIQFAFDLYELITFFQFFKK